MRKVRRAIPAMKMRILTDYVLKLVMPPDSPLQQKAPFSPISPILTFALPTWHFALRAEEQHVSPAPSCVRGGRKPRPALLPSFLLHHQCKWKLIAPPFSLPPKHRARGCLPCRRTRLHKGFRATCMCVRAGERSVCTRPACSSR